MTCFIFLFWHVSTWQQFRANGRNHNVEYELFISPQFGIKKKEVGQSSQVSVLEIPVKLIYWQFPFYRSFIHLSINHHSSIHSSTLQTFHLFSLSFHLSIHPSFHPITGHPIIPHIFSSIQPHCFGDQTVLFTMTSDSIACKLKQCRYFWNFSLLSFYT